MALGKSHDAVEKRPVDNSTKHSSHDLNHNEPDLSQMNISFVTTHDTEG